ncbi:MAG: carbonic anhydrase [Spirochaetes bacterium]|nr:carbonic anhydrase [Spirochaetota bacterium]
MEKILNGVVQFRQNDYETHKKLFSDICSCQKPHTLFIGCSDSRVVPSMIMQTLPGELFIVRNIANIVPPYRDSAEYFSTTSAIEYAVEALNVENIVVCGHSNCGGCMSLHMDSAKLEKLPHTRKWVELGAPVREAALKSVGSEDPSALEWMTEQINIVHQMKNLLSYPFIKERYQNGTIQIAGLYYIIQTGEVLAYNKETEYFEAVN